MIRFFILASFAVATAAAAQDSTFTAPSLRADVTVSSDIVRIGDLIDNAGNAAQIAVYRAPDLGTTGKLRAAQIIETVRKHAVIGVETRNIQDVSITRASRTVTSRDIEIQVAKALEKRNGLGDAANLAITFERDQRDLQLDASSGDLRSLNVRFDPRNGRFDVLFETADDGAAKLRFTGTAVETVEAAIPQRSIERGEIVKASDIAFERRPKVEAGNDSAIRDRVVGMQARKALRPGQIVKTGDLGKADMVTRDQAVTLIIDTPGIYLTGRGKAMESGTEGDVVSVMNIQSKRTVQGTVVGPGQVSIRTAALRATTTAALAAPINPDPVTAKAE